MNLNSELQCSFTIKGRVIKLYWFELQVVIPKTTPNAVFYNISIKGMDQMWQAYTFQVS